MTSPQITVVTAIRNGAAYIEETIQSVQAQDFADWEYIIVDDASTDDTPAIVERAAKADSRIQLLRRSDSAGPYVAANDALPLCAGKYIFRTDGDDLCPPGRFSRQLKFMQEHPEFRASVGFWQGFDQRGIMPHVVTIPHSPRVFKWHLLLRSASIHSTACFETAALRELGGYVPVALSQDYRMWCTLAQRNWLGVIPEVLSYVRFHEGRSTNQRTDLQRTLAMGILRDYWRELTGEHLTNEEIDDLWAVAYSLPHDVRRALRMLERWEQHWSQDPALTSSERRELMKLRDLRSWKMLRGNLRRQPFNALTSVSSLRELSASLGGLRQALFSR